MDNRRLLIAALLSAAVLIVWNIIFPPPQRVPVEEVGIESVEPSLANQEALPPAASPSAAPLESLVGADGAESIEALDSVEPVATVVADREDVLELETPSGVARITNRGGQLVSFLTAGEGATAGIEMVRARDDAAPFPFAWVQTNGASLPINDALFVSDVTTNGIRLNYEGPLGTATKVFSVSDDGRLSVEAQWNRSGWGLLLGPGIRNPTLSFLADGYQKHGAIFSEGGNPKVQDSKKVNENEVRSASGLRWVGLDDVYFLAAVVPETPLAQIHLLPGTVEAGEGEDAAGAFVSLSPDPSRDEKKEPRDLKLVLEPGAGGFKASAFFGAKNYDELKALDVGMEKSIRWPRFFRGLARPLQIGLNWLYENVVRNYGWCIVLMTFLLRLVLLPLTHKSYTSMQKMQQLNPKMEAIRARYRPKLKDKDGRPNFEMQRKMNDEIQGIFKAEGVNPVGGCLPMLVQLPVFLSFFYLLRGAPELWRAPWEFWINDLSAPDPIYVLPVLMGVTQLISNRFLPTSTNKTQQIIMNTFPIWFTFIALGFPSGLVLYWLTNNILTAVQQGGYNRLKKAGYFGGLPEEAAKKGSKKDKAKKAKAKEPK